jgi:hypothetical protein
MSEYVPLIADDCRIFQRVMYLYIDGDVPVQVRAAYKTNLFALYETCLPALLGRWQGQ